jgi:nucleoid-associated protein YgaU
MIRLFFVFVCCALVAVAAEAQVPASLKGSKAKVEAAHKAALDHRFTFLKKDAEVARFVSLGLLVPIYGNENYRVDGARLPYVRPEVKLFVERLSSQYRGACGEKLDITGATRTVFLWNSSAKSAHPTGMAVDFRVPRNVRCRAWLESTLIAIGQRGVIIPTREVNPPHYHVVVFPRQYAAYVAARTGGGTTPAGTYRVKAGDTLSGIASRHKTTVRKIMEANGLKSSTVRTGQTLRIPR